MYPVKQIEGGLEEQNGRMKRGVSASEIVGGIFGTLIPSVGVALNSVKLENILLWLINYPPVQLEDLLL